MGFWPVAVAEMLPFESPQQTISVAVAVTSNGGATAIVVEA
jgi:hypothetical protein